MTRMDNDIVVVASFAYNHIGSLYITETILATLANA